MSYTLKRLTWRRFPFCRLALLARSPLPEDRVRRAPRLFEARPPANVGLLQPPLGQLPELCGVVVEGVHHGEHRPPPIRLANWRRLLNEAAYCSWITQQP